MATVKFEQHNKKGIRRSMYIALTVCMAALAVGAWSASSRINSMSSEKEKTTTQQSVQQVERIQTSVPAQAVEKSETTTAQQMAEAETSTVTQATENSTASVSKKNAVASYFVLPIGSTVSKKYSDTKLQYSETFLDWRLHKGIDLEAAAGTAVHAAGNGKVTQIYDDPLLGNTIVIDHGNAIVGYYSGIAGATVKVDDIISAGDVIGGVGKIPGECVEASHIHFATEVDGHPVDPLDVIKIEN